MQAAPSLHDHAERAWQREPLARQAEGRLREAQASEAQARAWIPGAPALTLSHRDDHVGKGVGAREQEVGISTPLWAPGQQQASLNAAQTQLRLAQAELARVRWLLAGQVREAFWQAVLADQQEALSRAQHAALTTLQADVHRRVKAGDLARADAMLIEQKVFEAQSTWLTTRLKQSDSRRQWHALTGATELPPWAPSELPDEVNPASHAKPQGDWHDMVMQHPEMVHAQAALAHARSQVMLAERAGKQAPELGLRMVWQRDLANQGSDRSLGLSVRWPLGDEPIAKVKLAEAESAQEQAQAAVSQLHNLIDNELRSTADAVAVQGQRLAGARRQAQLAQERLVLINKAFELGNISLPEHLQAVALAMEAQASLTQDLTQMGRALARHEQAKGVLP